MALVPCRECGKEVSDKADKCPNCGISTPSKTRRQIKLAITAIILLLVIGGSVLAYQRVTHIFDPPVALDADGKPLPPPPTPKLQKAIPIKQQILQTDAKDKVGEMLDSDKSVREISNETGLSKKEIRRIKKEKAEREKEKEAEAAAKK